ncbi:MAG: spoVB [Clostridiales bacterium]|nr:spoVB [Clostridiales bacterium]
MKRSAFFEKTIILTLSNIITGTLTFAFSIILSREIGSKGVGLYQLVMPVYMLFLSFTGGGITVTVSKIAAEKKAVGSYNELYKTVKALCVFEFIWSLVITAFVLLGSTFISSTILADKRTLYGIIAFCPAIVIVSISSVFKGAFYGLQRVIEPALIDIVEKIGRVLLIFLFVRFTRNSGIEVTSAAAVFSLSCGELISFLLFFICYKNFVRKHPGYGKSDNSPQLILNVLKLSVPLALTGILSTIFSTLATVMIPKRLQAAGMPYESALSLLGKLQGMALTIAFYPTIIIGAINVLLIPSISEAVAFKKNHIVNHRINISLTIASVAAFSSAAIMMAIPGRLGQFLYKDPAVGEILRVLVPGIPIIYIEMVTFSILNGLGKQTKLLINSIILSATELTLIYIFLGIPSLNIKGYAVSFIISGILGLILSFIVIRKTVEFRLNLYSCLILPMLCSVLLFILTTFFLDKLSSTPLIVLLSYAFYMIIYLPMYSYSKKQYR